MRYSTDPPPAEAAVIGNLKIYIYENEGKVPAHRPNGGQPLTHYLVKVWRGKAQKPYAHIRFNTPERRSDYVLEQVDADKLSVAFKKEQAEKEAALLQEMREKITVGTIFHYSWGYDQTNCEFFQVVRKSGAVVWIRPIAGREEPGSAHGYYNRMKPCRDRFIGTEEIRKTITAYGLSMPHGGCRPCGDNESFHNGGEH